MQGGTRGVRRHKRIIIQRNTRTIFVIDTYRTVGHVELLLSPSQSLPHILLPSLPSVNPPSLSSLAIILSCLPCPSLAVLG